MTFTSPAAGIVLFPRCPLIILNNAVQRFEACCLWGQGTLGLPCGRRCFVRSLAKVNFKRRSPGNFRKRTHAEHVAVLQAAARHVGALASEVNAVLLA